MIILFQYHCMSSVLCKLQIYLISVPVVIKFNFNVVVLVI